MKENCWEVKKCGRHKGGHNEKEMGICPASNLSINNMNSGKNAGRICWAVAGTFCDGARQGSFAEKKTTCMSCDFFALVRHEEGKNFKLNL